jgi:hypothetical protein
MRAAVEQKLARNRAARQRRQQKKRAANPAAELHREWAMAMREHCGVELAPWDAAEYALGKRLVQEVGYERAVDLVRYFVSTWPVRRSRLQERRDDLPGMKLCWTIRGRLGAEIDGVVSRPTSKRERVIRGEFDPISAEASPKVGWGD